ncbi:MAG: hypothetical protein J6U63_06545, partial [Clostridia bacterium]|nr:hypothetical protein [Clostridia bacterium]
MKQFGVIHKKPPEAGQEVTAQTAPAGRKLPLTKPKYSTLFGEKSMHACQTASGCFTKGAEYGILAKQNF